MVYHNQAHTNCTPNFCDCTGSYKIKLDTQVDRFGMTCHVYCISFLYFISLRICSNLIPFFYSVRISCHSWRMIQQDKSRLSSRHMISLLSPPNGYFPGQVNSWNSRVIFLNLFAHVRCSDPQSRRTQFSCYRLPNDKHTPSRKKDYFYKLESHIY
jgi:hypothetical protein